MILCALPRTTGLGWGSCMIIYFRRLWTQNGYVIKMLPLTTPKTRFSEKGSKSERQICMLESSSWPRLWPHPSWLELPFPCRVESKVLAHRLHSIWTQPPLWAHPLAAPILLRPLGPHRPPCSFSILGDLAVWVLWPVFLTAGSLPSYSLCSNALSWDSSLTSHSQEHLLSISTPVSSFSFQHLPMTSCYTVIGFCAVCLSLTRSKFQAAETCFLDRVFPIPRISPGRSEVMHNCLLIESIRKYLDSSCGFCHLPCLSDSPMWL